MARLRRSRHELGYLLRDLPADAKMIETHSTRLHFQAIWPSLGHHRCDPQRGSRRQILTITRRLGAPTETSRVVLCGKWLPREIAGSQLA